MILISRKYCFLAVNFLMVFCMLLSITDSTLAGSVTKLKFLFIGYCFVDIVLRREKPANNHVLAIMFIFIFYTIVWGFILDNSHVASWNAEHRNVMVMFIFMLFCGVYELIAYKCISGCNSYFVNKSESCRNLRWHFRKLQDEKCFWLYAC